MNINQQFKKGKYTTTLKDIHTKTYTDVRQALIKLLQPAVQDQELLNILTEEQNIQKIKHRIEVELQIRHEKLGIIGTAKTIAKHTPTEALEYITKEIHTGENIKDTHLNTIRNMKREGYDYKHENNGIVRRIDMKITFRKG